MRARSLVATLGVCTLGLAAGCERVLSIEDPVAGNGPGSDGGSDGSGGDDGGLPTGSPLLLSEVVIMPTEGEMIEIVNTSDQPVDLSTYYLSDSGNNYFKLPVQKAVDLNDFIVKFPDNAVIPGHGVFTVALDTAVMFSTVYQKAPTFSVVDPGSMVPVATNGQATLTNAGEIVILFQWDGRSDLVRDVDIVLAGVPVGNNGVTPKSGLSQDGVDADTAPSTYATDKNSIRGQAAAPGVGFSTKRLMLEAAGGESHDGTGNGQSGDDETSEDTSLTWDGTAGNPFTLPNPGMVPSALQP